MRTLTLLTTLLLLALHTQAESPQGSTKEAPDEEQDISVFFGGDKGTALQDAAVKAGVTCSCRTSSCRFGERLSGACRLNGRIYRLCC
uniref:Neutrophil antibiotic peptide NP-3A n=1 Tax=Rattus norvegicus TaxID=10116 RepID=DEF3A_RAT|nr:RecName: Full=Neutrophil antibiotic peptide NP-3A; Short=RatNP-3a; AltName: Full=Neutrophil defensin 3; Flags: Precursor [Rattus norvegicus]AAA91971.1 defensin RatNP-3 precursor [Rattus norvegicus]AAC99551.1 defensin 3a [Rattus norvegicus]